MQDVKKHSKTTPTNIERSVAKGNFGTGIRHILKRGNTAMKAFRKIAKNIVKSEMKAFIKGNCYQKLTGVSSIENFKWIDVIHDMQSSMPTIMECLE